MTLLTLLIANLLQPVARMDFVSLCEIVRHPELYDQKSVLTSGIYRAGPEKSDFIDPACPPEDDNDISTFPAPSERRVQDSRGWKQMEKIIERDKQALAVVRAVFDAYRRYDDPLPEDPRIQEILRQGNSRFGHLNFARFRLRIERVEFTSSVNK